jgi:hypothetical protein
MAEVARHEQQVLRRERRDESDQRRAIAGRHARDFDWASPQATVRG